MSKPYFLIVLAAILMLANQQCSQTAQNDLLQSGSTFFYNANSGPNTKEHIYQFPLAYSAPQGQLQVVASSSNFQVSSNGGVSFEIVGGTGSTSAFGAILLLIGQDSIWTSIRVFYLASSRTDFFLGTFSAGIYLQQKFSPGNSISLAYTLPNWPSPQESFTPIALLSGLRTSASSYAVTVGAITFDSLLGQLVVQLNINSSIPIESISISYIIFGQSAPFTFSNFNAMAGSSATYQFIGIMQVNNGNSLYSGYGFDSQAPTQAQINCVGGNCPSQCITAQDCQRSNGFISQGVCLLCLQGQIPTNGGCQVRPSCGLNQYYNGTACVCYMGYLLVNSVCFPGCGTNAYIINSQCVCIPGYTYSSQTNSCIQRNVPTCGANFILVNNKCVCKSGFGLVNNICVACPANSRIVGGKCICDSGFTLSSSTLSCVSDCFPNSFRNIFGQCVCNNGYYTVGNSCVAVSSCVNGQVWNGTGCSCPQRQVTDSITNQCTYCNTPDRMVSATTCLCSPQFYPTDIGCSQCTNNSVYNSVSKSCQCLNGYEMQNNLCVLSIKCPLSSVWNSTTLKCDCSYFGEYVINGFCQPCQLNSAWNGTACACKPGFVANGPLCNCPSNTSWNGVICACNKGFMQIGDSCAQCDVSSVYLSALQPCVCKPGWYGIYNKCSQCDPSCATCSGPSTGNCLTCPPSTNLSNGKCISIGCSTGQYVDKNNNCQPCVSNCANCSDGSSCTICQTGYKLTLAISAGNLVNTCQLVPAGSASRLTLRGQVVGNGVVYQGVALNLMPTAILANGCSICNSLLKVNAVSSFTTITTSVQYIQNSQYWFVAKFNLGNVPFIPSFQFNIQINPQYASYFSPEEMAQALNGISGANGLSDGGFALSSNKQELGTSNGNKGTSKPQESSLTGKDNSTLLKLFG